MSMHRSRHLHARLGRRAKGIAAAGSAASCLVMALGAGGGVANASSVRSAAKSTFVIGSVLNDLTNPFQATMGKAEQAEASKRGVTIHVVSGNVNGSISISQQVAEVQQFISRKVNMILVTPLRSERDRPSHQEGKRGRHPGHGRQHGGRQRGQGHHLCRRQ